MTVVSTQKPTFIIIEDHESSLLGTKAVLNAEFPSAEILTAQYSEKAQEIIRSCEPHLVIADLVLPESLYDEAKASTGRRLISLLMADYPNLNIVVQSAQPETLIRLKSTYELHQGSFVVIGKKQTMQEFLTLVRSALNVSGFFHTPSEMRRRIEVREEWSTALHLAYEEGLQDSAIAKRMNVSERTVQNYFQKLRDTLDVYLEEGQSIREQLAIKSRSLGLID